MPFCEIVRPRGRVFSPFGRAFLALINGFGYIRRNSGLPKKVVLMQNLFIGQKAEITVSTF